MRLDVRVWLVLGAILAFASDILEERLWVLSWVPTAAWAVTGLVLSVRHALRIPSLRETYGRSKNLVGVFVGFLLFDPVAWLGSDCLVRARFRWHREEYDAIVLSVRQGWQPPEASAVTVDAGPPIRVAFRWPGSIVDNWCGAVYDVTGEVVRINDAPLGSAKRYSAEIRPIESLFGGDMTACRVLDRPYFLCCFT